MSEHTCPTCGRVLASQRGVAVHHSRSHGEKLPNRSCKTCGADFYSEYEKRYCSESCRSQGVSYEGEDNPNYSGGRQTTTCQICGDIFEFYPSEKEGKYCGSCVEAETWQETPSLAGDANPNWSGGKQQVACAVCGDSVKRWPSEMAEIAVCSETCRQEWLAENFTGEDHPNWKGGGNIEYGPGWNKVRREALERDTHTCQSCGISAEKLDRNPDVHHIVPVRWFLDTDGYSLSDAHSLNNVISLCPSCHRKAEFGTIATETLCAEIGTSPEQLPPANSREQ